MRSTLDSFLCSTALASTFTRHMLRRAAPHNWLNLAMETPHLVPPTALVSATAGASFYASWTMLSFLFIAPIPTRRVLYAAGSARPQSALTQLRFTLRFR
jgi:hypothetical protein